MIDVFALSAKAKPLTDRKSSSRPIMTFEEAMKALPSNPETWNQVNEMAKEIASKAMIKE